MSHPWFHAKSSQRTHGGEILDYIDIHNFFDQTKAAYPDIKHRAVLHSSFGIFLAEQVFGVTFKRKSDGKEIPTRLIGEQHVKEDLAGRIPTIQDWLQNLPVEKWMCAPRKLSQEFKDEQEQQEYNNYLNETSNP